ncbi:MULTISPECIES: hypothetical protein [Streptomyces]|uniref:hypothetical protein n=1 Tax=Streptomyces TaxID=1883 RepID=UPI00240DF0FA|nr:MULTISPECIES: hypothetical protein [Streptomyces]WFB88368.1 hypothetical protein MMU79_36535 [Streptomyces olivaceus]WGK50810.1 hypothetical protein M6G09_37275 [Streptomyces sp. B146]
MTALEADPQAAADAYAFTAFQAAQQAADAYQDNALAVLGRTREAEAEARRAYRLEQAAPGSSTTRPARTPSPPRRTPPTRRGSA